jgi:hypothetical protein
MDVVRNETASLGGRIEISSVSGKGATFRVYLPLTLAVTQVVLVTIGSRHYAVPSSMIEQATEHRPAAAAEIRKPAAPNGWATPIRTTISDAAGRPERHAAAGTPPLDPADPRRYRACRPGSG